MLHSASFLYPLSLTCGSRTIETGSFVPLSCNFVHGDPSFYTLPDCEDGCLETKLHAEVQNWLQFLFFLTSGIELVRRTGSSSHYLKQGSKYQISSFLCGILISDSRTSNVIYWGYGQISDFRIILEDPPKQFIG